MKKHLLLFVFGTALAAQDYMNVLVSTNTALWSNIVSGISVTYITNKYDAPAFIDTIITNAAQAHSISTNAINAICAAGEICRVKGHFWRNGRPGESATFSYGDYHPNTSYRTCSLCGTTQSQTREWK